MALNCCTSPVRLPVGLVQPRCCLLSVASFPLLHAFCTRDLSSAEAASSVVRWPSFRSSLAASGQMSMQKAITSGSTIVRWPIASCVLPQVLVVLTAGSRELYGAAKGLLLFGGSRIFVQDCLNALDRMFMRPQTMLCAGGWVL